MKLNEKIKYYRKDLNLTQQELADLSGISLRALSNYEKGLRSEERRVGKECRSRWSPYH